MKELYRIGEDFKEKAETDFSAYQKKYAESVNNPDVFWAKEAERLTWTKKWSKVKNTSFTGDVSIKWFEDGKLNVAYNCIDRHLEKRSNQTAIIWEGDNPAESRKITYKELHVEVCKLTNALVKLGVKKGDRVTIYMPMVPEAAYAMLAVARLGAVHSVVFGGFSPDALADRIDDAASDIVITSDESLRGGKKVPLKANVDAALEKARHKVKSVIVLKRTGGKIEWATGRDVWYHDIIASEAATHEAQSFDAEDPLFILYTSGSTGKPKGALHTSAGYLLFAAATHEYVFDCREGDVYWCTADVGWVTGHSYIVYGPLANGATTLMFEGVPTYPDASRFWQIIDKYSVNIFYTAPTAIRSLMAVGDDFVTRTSRKSLRVLGSVGEPINPEAWRWYYEVVGNSNCPIVDTWWQTETGGHLITPLAGVTNLKPGSASFPFYGVQPAIMDKDGKEIAGEAEGVLCIKDSWPGQMRTIYGDHKRFIETYFSHYPGYYFSGDGAKRDKDGYYWITGRVDDVLNVSGHRIGTAEVESALVSHPKVSEAAVVGIAHHIKGQAIYAYVTLKDGFTSEDAPNKELIHHVRKEIGPIAAPDFIHFTPALPKTRSGKIMRRILRKIANRETDNLGDISTLLNPEIVELLIEDNKKLLKI